MKYLVAEDELDLQQSIVTYLQRDGNICEVASDFGEASEKAAIYDYDVIILDINLISGSGLDVLRFLKKEKKRAGVIIISANNSLTDKLEGLDLGADDYITKPFHLAELNSRIKAVLRRGKYGGDEIMEFNEIKIDTKSRTAYIDGKAIALTRKEYDLLVFFISNKGRVLSKEIIAEHLWGDNSDLLDNFDFIYVHINNLRKKLTAEGAKYIKTAYGSGYKFIED
ncbi:response regulator with CheY-like receiver domain and winged-helix DNA-binding domain [Cellulophaga geojensis KL-A]|uniref:Response regulator with CheY-like receiver domain and winged-helix DNA-binding domain n=1 Tax=Cellulophaga geojensis KL-A TaxID=1328323 RepID=A0ABN0RS08_9FLAO|nr:MULTISPECIES: response regulator transcription factor [Cellulophaga]APU11617.1 DNA-binding response regulator [Cellulophaga lytica]EWH14704.1 response regulator with CheY-like receiver domain and winged-helix DNA-binding domain [Cellulophaga geojensis KL-A]PKB44330.1 DNA-binding response OmpR family regulator [Cellulophaga sp. RHA19]TVZ09950.1 DNA-binding response OmpR family regulator [Cellulophaga sp. RHA_52]WKB81068.1 response regulator transcription factor [Cellulophaga lytica]